MPQTLFVAVHIGCGFHLKSKESAYKKVLTEACVAAMKALRQGQDALEAAVAGTVKLETCPLTNTGVGSNLNRDGHVECDASVMLSADPSPKPQYFDTSGPHMIYGAVGAVAGIKFPSTAAHAVARNAAKEQDGVGLISPICLVASGAVDFVRSRNVEVTKEPKELITGESRRRYESHSKRKRDYDLEQASQQLRHVNHQEPHQHGTHYQQQHRKSQAQQQELPSTFGTSTKRAANTGKDPDNTDRQASKRTKLSDEDKSMPYDTVGVITLDQSGRSAAVCSSGGISLKLPGRVGQAATFGAGGMASFRNNISMATVTTGVGEELVKTQFATQLENLLCDERPDEQGGDVTNFSLEKHVTDLCLNSSRLGPNARHEMGFIGFRAAKQDDNYNKLEFIVGHTTSSFGIAYMCDSDEVPTCDFGRSDSERGSSLYYNLKDLSQKL
eukprot:m.156539 g.156539  ORF g.156539 m.156539 type:complete len:443 (-) comp31002_c0_seq1:112-1440(-)